MNYIELFANGGLTKSEKSEGEQRAIQLLESLQELTGVDPKQAAEILNQFKDDPETVNSIQEYVNLAVDPQSDENTRSNAISELTKIFNPSMESQYFKCGGKLQQLVTKFGKGGPVDCGCSGIKLDNGGKTISADGSITIVNPNTAQADTLGRYSYPSTNGKFKLLSNGERSATVWDNTGGFPIARYANETFMQNHPVRSFLGGYKPAPAGYFENLVDRVNNRFDENGVPTKQDGGTVKELDFNNISNNEARYASQHTMGFNEEQYNRAYQNALAALRRNRPNGLRGEALRNEARRMVMGLNTGLNDNPYYQVPTTSMQDAKAAMLSNLPTVDYSKYNEVVPEEVIEEELPIKHKSRKADPIYGTMVNDMLKRIGTGSTSTKSLTSSQELNANSESYIPSSATNILPEVVVEGRKTPKSYIHSGALNILPEVTIEGRKASQSYIPSSATNILPEVVVEGKKSNPQSYIHSSATNILPEVTVEGYKTPTESYIHSGATNILPEVTITGRKSMPQSYIPSYASMMFPEVTVEGRKSMPESYTLGYINRFLPEVTVEGRK